MSDTRICAVFDPDFGDRVYKLVHSSPVWIIQSQRNSEVVSELWKAKAGDITSFQPQSFDQLIDSLDMHHPHWLELEVHGVSQSDADLSGYGNGTYEKISGGFIFRRDRPTHPSAV